MNWLMPLITLPRGRIRSVGRFDRKAYDRAYYHTKRKGRVKQAYTPEQLARRRESRRLAYYTNIERERANARVRYWRNRDRYAASALERLRALRSKTLSEGDSGKRGFPAVRPKPQSGEAVRASVDANPRGAKKAA